MNRKRSYDQVIKQAGSDEGVELIRALERKVARQRRALARLNEERDRARSVLTDLADALRAACGYLPNNCEREREMGRRALLRLNELHNSTKAVRIAAAASVLDRKVTVCAECLCASCWQGELMCFDAKGARTVEKTVRELHGLGVESPEYWFKDAGTGKVNQAALAAYRTAVEVST